ncbi:MAG: phenylalanine--tRNA ligase subunit alpha [Promethearchaeota archaeon]
MLELNERQKLIVKNLTREFSTLDQIQQSTGLPVDVIRSILASLTVAKYVESKKEMDRRLVSTNEGKLYAEQGFPEQLLVSKVKAGISAINELKELFEDKKAFNIAILWSKKKGWIKIYKGKVELVAGIDEIEQYYRAAKRCLSDPAAECDEDLVAELRSRHLLEEREIANYQYRIHDALSDQQLEELITSNKKDILTSEDIITGAWRNYTYKEFIITDKKQYPVHFGRRNAYLDFLNQVREALLNNGFEEFLSPSIDLELYNCDLLYMPQDHIARGIHDIFYVDSDEKGEIENQELFKRMCDVHLNGGDTGSRGWGYKVDEGISRNLILRSQTTCTSAHFVEYLAKHRPDDDVKMVCIDLNWRPDTRDRTHSFEFRQCEGIITGDNLSIRNLLGILEEICHSIGIKEIKFMPGYFPFTEPSVSGFVKHPTLGWIEALPGGMFRPEVLAPFNYQKTVLAYGIGIDRLAMAALGIDDIRELYSQNINQLKSFPVFRG